MSILRCSWFHINNVLYHILDQNETEIPEWGRENGVEGRRGEEGDRQTGRQTDKQT